MKSDFYASSSHYYGDIVRKLFFAGAVVMLVTLPMLNNRLPVSTFASLLVIVAIGFFAGLTNPIKRAVAVIDTGVSIVATIVFEYYAVMSYQSYGMSDALFLVNQGLAVLFLVALYYSTKTFRAMIIEKK